MRFPTILATLFLASWAAYAQSPWLTNDGYDQLHVVVCEQAAEKTALAGEEFARYWESCTGHRPAISAGPGGGTNIFIGVDALPEDKPTDMDLSSLDDDGFLIRVLDDKALLIAGNTPAGTLNGVYEFFERFMGVRWLSFDATYIPAAPDSLPRIDYRFVPPYKFRWTTSYYGPPGSQERGRFERVHRVHPPQYGGSWGHNLYRLVPPPEYYPDHPEYYGMNEEGERVALPPEQWGRPWSEFDHEKIYQLCMTNPDLPEVIMKSLRKWQKQSPDADFYCVMQEDIDQHCLCPACAAIDDAQGTPMGSLLTGVNSVADLFADEFPGGELMTFAYAYTRHAPKSMTPHDNVAIMLCTIECEYLNPIGPESEGANGEFFDDLLAWSKLTDKLHVYTYAPNYHAWMEPHPNFHTIVPNLRAFCENGAEGVFVQGSGLPNAGMLPLRSYLILRGMWNPNMDWEAAQDEFLQLYYGAAAPYMDAYIRLATETVRKNNGLLTCFDDGGWVDIPFLEEAIGLMEQGMAAAESETIARRVKEQWLRLQYAALTCAAQVSRGADDYIFQRPATVDSTGFLTLCREFGITSLDEQYGRPGVPLEQSVVEHMGPIGSRTPKRVVPYTTIKNNRYSVDIAPAYSGAIMRWMDREFQREILGGKAALAEDRGMLQEWTVRTKEHPTEEPLHTDYRVAATTADSVTLETTLANGLKLRRTTALAPGEAPLTVRWEVSNETGQAAKPLFKVHPEFAMGGDHQPEIWLQRNGKWTKHPLKTFADGLFGGDAVDPAGVERWAARVPGEDLIVTCAIEPDQWEALFYFFNTRTELVNLELIPKLAPIEPGETRVFEVRYASGQRLP